MSVARSPARRPRGSRNATRSASCRGELTVLLLHNVDPSWAPAERDEALEAVDALEAALIAEGRSVTPVAVTTQDLVSLLAPWSPDEHVVFNWCEELPGLPRSDVTVAEVLEDLGFTYTGATPAVLALTWDKVAVKKRLRSHRIATPHFQVCTTARVRGWSRFPAIVKPAFEHCSEGIEPDAVVRDAAELEARVGWAIERFAQPVLVEDFIDGRELHVTVWGNGVVEALPPAEMDFSAFDDPRERVCGFESKFTPGSRGYEMIDMRVPAALEPDEIRRLNRVCLRTYRALECRDFARIDLRMRDGLFCVLDVNPNADLSPDTSLRYSAEHAGWSYGAVASRLVAFAAERHPRFGCLDAASI